MGRGNWFPGSQLSECRVVYVDLSSEEDDDLAWFDFNVNLEDALGKSFRDCDARNCGCDDVGRDDIPIFRNNLFCVFIDGRGDNYHLGIGLRVLEDAPAFAASRLDEFADKLFDKLQATYPLRVRTSAWTSAERAMGKT